ncbi:carboxypeptidase-like regulatory domain-containing protein [Dyella sp. A6]|uniref:carboxypeptidase-like regulatory domain-containing protein n=1 Tax=Dyella aluminiiresistens TaxID=3069105 RepID=UPI002E7865AD|nr:carboxypeptidase-like regulatory domain-containing protein [Dyella sp. A6]
MIKARSNRTNGQRGNAKLMLVAIAGVCSLAAAVAVNAQSTVGSVFGKAPAGDTVSARSMQTGAGREVKVNSEGRYFARELPTGVYTVVLKKDGKPVAKHINVPVVVGRGSEVDFAK